jgi:hypothetical protein
MDKSIIREGKVRGRAGFVLIGLIISISILLLLFALYAGGILNPFAPWQGTEADRYSDPNAYPWEEYDLFFPGGPLDGYDMSGRRPPFRGQPRIKDGLFYEAELYDDGGEQMGEIELTIYKDFYAKAVWSGEFKIGDKRYEVVVVEDKQKKNEVSVFNGNIAPFKIYEDEDGRDKSKLYVITAGSFRLKEMWTENSVTGFGYVTAWINKKYEAEGELAIRSFIGGEEAIYYWGPVEQIEEYE